MSVDSCDDFATVLRLLLHRPTHTVTPGWLSKISGISKATIVNWLSGRVARPRSIGPLIAVCDALRLTPNETKLLYGAAGMVPGEGLVPALPFDRVPVGLYATTPDGRILFANDTLVRMLGYSSIDQYRRIPVEQLYEKPMQREAWLNNIQRVEVLAKEPVRARRNDGSIIVLLDSATVVRNALGGVQYFEGVWEFSRRRLAHEASSA